MTDPPYSRINNQRPKYVQELQINWTGVPLFNKKYYLIKAGSTAQKLTALQNSAGVIDFPDVDTDLLSSLPQARKTKNTLICTTLGIASKTNERVLDFINRVANSERENGWRKDIAFVQDE